MKKLFYLLFLVNAILSFACTHNMAYAQNIDKISQRCKSPNQSVYGVILVTGDGDITQTPCPTKTNIFSGNVDFSLATVTGISGTVSGGQLNFVPRFASSTSLTTTPLSYDGTTYTFNQTAGFAADAFRLEQRSSNAGTGAFSVGNINTFNPIIFLDQASKTITFNTDPMGMVIDSNAGIFTVSGDTGGANAKIQLTNGGNFNLTAKSGMIFDGGAAASELNGGVVSIGDGLAVSHSTLVSVTDSTKTISITGTGSLVTFDAKGVLTFNLQRTITAGGTTGNQTINKPNGSVNVAAGQSSIVITNSTVTTSSLINAVANTNDATCSVKNAVATANTITITMTAACTGETRVAFWSWN